MAAVGYQPARADDRIDQRLRRERAAAAHRMWAESADGKELRRHRYPECAGLFILGDDRPGHGEDCPMRVRHSRRFSSRSA
jgi:hypothetical protein